MKLGIVGLPNVGKSTLFNAITSAGAESANYPFCTIEPNVGVVDVPDPRIAYLSEMSHSKKEIYASCTFYDIAGLVRGASKGEGLGNQFLGHIREVDAIVHVVRCFDDENITHVDNRVNPARDIETINLELILSDLDTIEKIIHRTGKLLKGDRSLQKEFDLLQKAKTWMENEQPIRSMHLSDEEKAIMQFHQFLTIKPTIYVANVSLDDVKEEYVQQVERIAKEEGAEYIQICAQVEQEIAELSGDEKKEFLEAMGVEQSGLDALIRASYHLLNLISFLTTGEMETRAWSIKKGTRAQQAAGKIHSDIERGFIRAEIINYDELHDIGSMQKAKELGKLRLEGKEYIMKDGDVVHFRFNV